MVISIINQKGGVGKTTTAVNLAVALAQWGQPTLLVDLDPQGNATSGVGCTRVNSPTLYDALAVIGEEEISSEPGDSSDEADQPAASSCRPATTPGPVENLQIIGATADLAGAEVELAGNPRRDTLRRVLAELRDEHPLIIVDTPPSLSLLTVNSLVAADSLIIPVQCEYYALEGLGQLLRTVERIRRGLNPHLQIMGLLRTMFDARLGLSLQVSRELELHFSAVLFQTTVPRNVRLAEAPSHGKPIALYDRRSPGADAYRRLALEVLARAGLQPANGPAAASLQGYGSTLWRRNV